LNGKPFQTEFGYFRTYAKPFLPEMNSDKQRYFVCFLQSLFISVHHGEFCEPYIFYSTIEFHPIDSPAKK